MGILFDMLKRMILSLDEGVVVVTTLSSLAMEPSD